MIIVPAYRGETNEKLSDPSQVPWQTRNRHISTHISPYSHFLFIAETRHLIRQEQRILEQKQRAGGGERDMARVRLGTWMRAKAEEQTVQSEKPRLRSPWEGQDIRTGCTSSRDDQRENFLGGRLSRAPIWWPQLESSHDSSPFAALGFCELPVQRLVLDSSQSLLWSLNATLSQLQRSEAMEHCDLSPAWFHFNFEL